MMLSRALRQHLFTLLSLLGCIAAWETPRLFPLHHLPEVPDVPQLAQKTPALAKCTVDLAIP